MAKKLITTMMMIAMMAPVTVMTGCNTVQGAGKDIERGGEKIQQESKEVQKKM